MKQLLIKIVKNPRRACAAFYRRMRVFFKKFYFWICFKTHRILYIHTFKNYEYKPIIPEQLKKPDYRIIKCAYASLDIYGNFLGVQINDPLPPWNEDVRLRDKNNAARFFEKIWYSKIKISVHEGTDLGSDIKVPWMLGRLNHLTLWAYAYYHTKDEHFLKKCILHLEDFIEKNPPYYGVQWTCAMEVALRAINIIISISLLDKEILADLKKRLYNFLMYHVWYIQNHWELYDGKTNNHYLSNLVGYWWLCSFFKINDERRWCGEKIIKEVEKQQLSDGTFYEGSTAYHRLSTDLISMALAIDTDGLLFSLKEKSEKMEQVCTHFHYNENDMILIGDNDSSPVLHPQLLDLMRQKPHQVQGIFNLKDFGLDILKNDTMHVTLRHHVYNPRQPSGHFHDDCNAITLALNNKLCIVDPGTYVYTSSLPWRHALRASSAHATCFLRGNKKQVSCFNNPIKEKKYSGATYSDDRQTLLSSSCDCQNFVHERYVDINPRAQKIIIQDYISADKRNVVWQLPVRGKIIRTTNNTIEFDTDDVIWHLHLQQKWCINQAWYAPSYGILEPIISVVIQEVKDRITTSITWR
jgi:hypothetical protein